MLRNLLITFLFFGACFSYSQIPSKKGAGQSTQNLVSTMDHDTCLNKKFSIIFYIVLDSNLSVKTSTPPRLKMIIDTLNKYFKPICVSFVNCGTVLIPNYPFNRWRKNATEPAVTHNWYAEKTINFYICDSIKQGAGNTEARSYSYPPPNNPGDTTRDVFVMESFKFLPTNNVDANLAHMFHNMGHYFGLSHTYAELNPGQPAVPGPPNGVVSQEFADGSNGTIHGDMIADTEADQGLSSQKTDGKGDTYIAPIDNFMNLLGGCRYSQQQYNLMARTILTKRLYLH